MVDHGSAICCKPSAVDRLSAHGDGYRHDERDSHIHVQLFGTVKAYRFFFHYHRASNGMTVHFRGKCIPCRDVVCNVPVESKWNKQQPRLVMRGFAKEVSVEGEVVVIS